MTMVRNRVAALLPEDGELMFTMVPQSNVANEFLAMDNREYFTSEAEEMIDTFSADNVHAFSTAQILSDSLVRGDYVYFRTDLHWTPEGAYLVYCEMVKAAGLTPTPWEDFNIETEENFLGIADIMLSELRDSLAARGLDLTWDAVSYTHLTLPTN